jgi:RNA polymerase sigma-70 factor (ECF subfamily)
MKIIEKRDLYDAERRFSTWLYTVAGNMVKNEYRRLSRRQAPPPLNEGFTEDFSIGYDQQVFEKELAAALGQLDESQRQCFVLRFQEELSLKEIAEIQDCPEGTVKSRLFYTIKKLSSRLRTLAGAVLLA